MDIMPLKLTLSIRWRHNLFYSKYISKNLSILAYSRILNIYVNHANKNHVFLLIFTKPDLWKLKVLLRTRNQSQITSNFFLNISKKLIYINLFAWTILELHSEAKHKHFTFAKLIRWTRVTLVYYECITGNFHISP